MYKDTFYKDEYISDTNRQLIVQPVNILEGIFFLVFCYV